MFVIRLNYAVIRFVSNVRRHVWCPLVSEWRVLKALSDQRDILLLKFFSSDDGGEAWTVMRSWRQITNRLDLLPQMSYHRTNSLSRHPPGLVLEEKRVASSASSSSLVYGDSAHPDDDATGEYSAEWRITEGASTSSCDGAPANRTLVQLSLSIDLNGRALAFYSHTWPRLVQHMLRALTTSFEVSIHPDQAHH